MHDLRRWRKEHGVTLETLAGRVNVSASHLSEIENGRNGPSLDLAGRLSRATDGEVPMDAFIRGAQ